MCQRDERVVVRVDACAAAIQFGVYRRDGPEEQERLIDEVATEVVEQAARLLRIAALAPASLRRRTPAIEPRFESKYRSQGVLGEEPPNGEKVAIPAAILKHGE